MMPSITKYSNSLNKFGKKLIIALLWYAIFREPGWKDMVVRDYIVREYEGFNCILACA